jgi:hypothetical protein
MIRERTKDGKIEICLTDANYKMARAWIDTGDGIWLEKKYYEEMQSTLVGQNVIRYLEMVGEDEIKKDEINSNTSNH